LRLFITGVAGFAGSHLLDHLAELGGYEAHGADHARLEAHPHADALGARLASYRALDITNAEAVDSWLAEGKPDALIHLAAQASGADSLERPVATYHVNAMGTLHVLDALRRTESRARVLVTGSADVYGSGAAGGLIREDAPLRPGNPYAGSKAAQDVIAEIYAATFHLPVIRTRTFSHTGPGQRPRFALAGFADQLARIDAGFAPPEIRVGNLDVTREYGDVRDVVRAYALLIGRGEAGEAYNVATGHGHKLRDLLDRLIEISGVKATVVVDPSRVRSRDADHLVGDPAKLADATGWKPLRSIEQTLSDLYRDARDRVRAGAKA
jgi:GDP-4-dehydro-6-deoxy-D-mannose reductase